MRFFTPELYLQGNSPEDDLVDQAEIAWQEATAAYRKYLDSVKDLLPVSVRALADACFHDAEILATGTHNTRIPDPDPTSLLVLPTFAIFLKDDRARANCITYFLWDEIHWHPAAEGWPFPAEKRYWLYEELEARQGPRQGRFRHKILLSTGEVLEIPFADAFILGPAQTAEV